MYLWDENMMDFVTRIMTLHTKYNRDMHIQYMHLIWLVSLHFSLPNNTDCKRQKGTIGFLNAHMKCSLTSHVKVV